MFALILGLACTSTDTGLTNGGGNGDTVPGTGRLTLSTEALEIPDVQVGYSKSAPFTVTSIGDANLIIYEIRIVADATDAFYFDEVEDITLAPKQEVTYNVVADLPDANPATGELRIRTNDPDYAAFVMPLCAWPEGWATPETACGTDTGTGTGTDTGGGDTGDTGGATG